MKIGKSEIEKFVDEMSKCRDIVSEILRFGVSEKQKLKIIYLLSLELEDREMMLKISNISKVTQEDSLEEEKRVLSLD